MKKMRQFFIFILLQSFVKTVTSLKIFTETKMMYPKVNFVQNLILVTPNVYNLVTINTMGIKTLSKIRFVLETKNISK